MPVEPVRCGKEDAFDIADRAAKHGADEERGREHAAGRAADERESGRDNFEHGEHGQKLPGELAVHGLIHGIVTGAHDLRSAEKCDEANEESGERGLKILRPARKGFEAGAKIADGLGEEHGGESADDAENGVGDEFGGTLEGGDRNAEQRLAAEKPAHDHDAGDRGENDGTEDAGAPASDDFFNDEQDGGDGSVEGGGESGGGADGSHQAKFFAGDLQPAAESGGDAGADLQRRIFRTERLSGADGERGADEFSDRGAEGNESVEDVERGLGLVDAAAADAGKDVEHQHGDDQASDGGNREQSPAVGLRQRARGGPGASSRWPGGSRPRRGRRRFR